MNNSSRSDELHIIDRGHSGGRGYSVVWTISRRGTAGLRRTEPVRIGTSRESGVMAVASRPGRYAKTPANRDSARGQFLTIAGAESRWIGPQTTGRISYSNYIYPKIFQEIVG